MSENLSKNIAEKCENCDFYVECPDVFGRYHYLCCQGGALNMFFFGPRSVSPTDVCKYFVAKNLQNQR